jgi:Dehydrogenases (flavoproteins)
MENRVQTLIVGAGPAGLACALRLKTLQPSHDVVVIDKAESPGGQALSGAVLETASLEALLDDCVGNWREDLAAKELLGRRIDSENILFLAGKNMTFEMTPLVRIARSFGLSWGYLVHHGNAIVSLSRLSNWLAKLAADKGVEILSGLAARDVLWDENQCIAKGVVLADQGIQEDGLKLPSYMEGETILSDTVVLAEGCDGLLTEQFIQKAGLKRAHPQMYSIGVKEILEVSPEQFKRFGPNRVVHAMGYPLWRPMLGPAMFGGGFLYAMGENRIAVGMIVGLDWKYRDFNPQEALQLFKNHAFTRQFISGGKVVEAGAKMIPEGGWRALPRDKEGSLGRSNVLILGDAAGFVNMIKIKGVHNALQSGHVAATVLAGNTGHPSTYAKAYTEKLSKSKVETEMRSASKFRQMIAKLEPTFGYPLSFAAGILPNFKVDVDFRSMTASSYPYKTATVFDKTTFTALAGTHHREGQASHLKILNRDVCDNQCKPKFQAPCITFCPAGVYEEVHGWVKPANPSNCLHCKTCQRKCPFDNIRWTVPEGGGGPRYTGM